MAIVPNDTRFIGISPSVNLTERRSARINRETQPVSMQDITDSIRPYKVFTALVSQAGNSANASITSGDSLILGVTYLIELNSDVDLTVFGAPNNDIGTIFICTVAGVLGDAELSFDTGAPVTMVLENTIGNIWFNFEDTGVYDVSSNGLFIEDKTYLIMGGYSSNLDGQETLRHSFYYGSNLFLRINTQANDDANWSFNNDVLNNTPIEIRVYN